MDGSEDAEAERLRACLAARGIALPAGQLAPILAGAGRLAAAARRLREAEEAGALGTG